MGQKGRKEKEGLQQLVNKRNANIHEILGKNFAVHRKTAFLSRYGHNMTCKYKIQTCKRLQANHTNKRLVISLLHLH